MSVLNRKEFLACSAAFLWGGSSAQVFSVPLEAAREVQEAKEDPAMKFAHDWVKELLKNLDSQLDEVARVRLMEANGRACARRGSVSMAMQNKGQMAKFLKVMEGHLGKGNARQDGNKVTLVYPECFCPLVRSDPFRLSETYCQCSVGWVKEMLETVSGKSVQVELLKSIKRGGDCCQFVVTV
jgi:predicted hydrocarbon binding protein